MYLTICGYIDNWSFTFCHSFNETYIFIAFYKIVNWVIQSVRAQLEPEKLIK